MRREAAASTFNTQALLLEHVQQLAEQAGMPCPPEAMERLALVLASAALHEREQRREVERRRELMLRAYGPGFTHWRDRCAHTPRCQRPTDCALKTVREGR